MSDDELLKSLDTYACQLREVNAQLIYAAKARIEALRGEVERLKEERDAAITDRFDAAAERIKAVTAERDRLSGEVATVRSARDMHHANYELMKAHNKELFGKLSAAELERDRLAGEVERLKDQNTAWADKYGDTQNAMYAALDERDRLKAALEPFAKLSTDRERQDPPEGTMRVRVVTAPEIEAARKALGGDAS